MKGMAAFVLLSASAAALGNGIPEVEVEYHSDWDYYTLGVHSDVGAAPLQLFVDLDGDPDTGYTNGEIVGADRLIEIYDFEAKDNGVYRYEGGSGAAWLWGDAHPLEEYNLWEADGVYYIDLDRYYLGLDQDPAEDRIRYRIHIWTSDWSDVLGAYPSAGMAALNEGQPPQGEAVFNQVVMASRLQEQADGGSILETDWYASQCFTPPDEGLMRFEIADDELKRCELRAFKDEEWPLEATTHWMEGELKIDLYSEETAEITWAQLHHSASNYRGKPLVRLAWIRQRRSDSDSDSGERYSNALWAVVRQNEGSGGSGTTHYHYLASMDRVAGRFFSFRLALVEGQYLQLVLDGNETWLELSSHWRELPQEDQNFYFKAGLYFSGATQYKAAGVVFRHLEME